MDWVVGLNDYGVVLEIIGYRLGQDGCNRDVDWVFEALMKDGGTNLVDDEID